MKKIRLLSIVVLLSSLGLSGCDFNLPFLKKNQEQSQQKEESKSQEEGNKESSTNEAKIKEIALKANARTTLSVTEKISTVAFFELKANSGKKLTSSDKKVVVTSSDDQILKVLNTSPTVSTYLEALKPGTVKLTIQSVLQEETKLEVNMTIIDSVFDRQVQDGFFGNNWDNVDMSHEVDEVDPYIKTVAEDGINHQFYFRDSYAAKSYAECEFTFYSEQDGSAHLPKLGFVYSTQEENDTHLQSCSMIYFDTDCTGGKTTYYNIGYNEIANSIWGWDKGGTDPGAKHYGVYRYEAGISKGETFKMGVVKEGYHYHVYFNDNYVKSIETTHQGFSVDNTRTEAAPTICGLFDFKSEVKYSNYLFTTDEAVVNAKIPATPDYTDINGN